MDIHYLFVNSIFLDKTLLYVRRGYMIIFVPLTGFASRCGDLHLGERIQLMSEIAKILSKCYGYVVTTTVPTTDSNFNLTPLHRSLIHADLRLFIQQLRGIQRVDIGIVVNVPKSTYVEVRITGLLNENSIANV